MTQVFIPWDTAYESVRDRESPLGESDRFRDDVFDWLDDHAGSANWDHDIGMGLVGGSMTAGCIVSIEDPKIALLFKLTWGGQ